MPYDKYLNLEAATTDNPQPYTASHMRNVQYLKVHQ